MSWLTWLIYFIIPNRFFLASSLQHNQRPAVGRLLPPLLARLNMVHSAASPYILSSDGTYYVLNRPIEKSDSDDRTYRIIKLKNDLEAMIIHDEKTDKASAALDVHVGSDSDPVS